MTERYFVKRVQARNQPARWGGVRTWMGGTPGAPPPLDIGRVTSSIWKTPPLLDIHKHPPLGHCPCDVIHIFQGWNKIAKGWNKIAEGWNKIAKGWNKIAERWNKIAKGWNKIAKGWNKIFGMGNWGGRTTPPRPPPLATGLGYETCTLIILILC